MDIKSINFKPNSTIFFISIITLIILASIGYYLDSHKYDNHLILNKEHSFKMEIDKMKIDHGVAVLNDSIIIPPGTILKKEIKRKRFTELDNPFTIIKKSGSFELMVIKYSDTLIFQLPDPNYKDPTDPTFKDFFEKLFNN